MYLLLFLALLVAALYTAYALYPSFGGKSPKGSWIGSNNFVKNIFVNQIPTSMKISGKDALSLLRQQLHGGAERHPKEPIRGESIDMAKFLNSTGLEIIWLGHSSVLIRLNGKTILTDPILSNRSSPFSFAGPKRTISQLPIAAEELPHLDAVVISHDHYDHLDYATIRKLKNKTSKFLVPLGIAAHLRKWGVADSQILELDWWDATTFEGLNFVCTPARHFSGRRLEDRFNTLWASWVIESAGTKVFLSGDTGYGPHFKQIGQKYGPFDLTLMECGQYDRRWPNIHMMPEDTVRAHQDLGGQRLFPIHWGAFVLALHPWAESVQRAQKAAKTAQVELLSAKIGEVLSIPPLKIPASPWWDDYLKAS